MIETSRKVKGNLSIIVKISRKGNGDPLPPKKKSRKGNQNI